VTPLIRAIVDTQALRHNLRRVRALAPGSRVMAVVKANAYGHGLVPTARALAEADGCAVARLDEALALRSAGLSGRILLLEGVFSESQLAAAAEHGLELMVHTLEQVALLERRAASAATALRLWIKIDTGMNRLGFRPEQFADSLRRLRRCAGIAGDPVLVTHLACADEAASPRTEAQLRLFADLTAGIPGERSIANSAGLLAWPGSRSDWVRPGLMLYGVSPFEGSVGADLGLQPAMRLETEVIAVKPVRAGESVGYGATWTAARDTRIAVLAAGYGDGFPRSVATGTPVRFAAGSAPLVGRVSMDMITVDVGALPPVHPGEPVELWGALLPVETIARRAGTLAYELLCGVSQRVALQVNGDAD
jgi:alanine racemase